MKMYITSDGRLDTRNQNDDSFRVNDDYADSFHVNDDYTSSARKTVVAFYLIIAIVTLWTIACNVAMIYLIIKHFREAL